MTFYSQRFSLVFLLVAWTDSTADFHATLTATSDYIGRGYSKSDGNFAGRANIDYQLDGGGYLGVSVTNVNFGDHDFDDPARFEITPYLGWSFGLSDDLRLELQWSRYMYDGNIFGHQSDYNEFYALAHYLDLFTVRASFSEDYYDQGNVAGDYELTGRYPVTDSVEISSSIGYSQTKSVLEYDYLYWNAGMTYFYKFAALDFRYFDALEVTPHDETVIINPWKYDPTVIQSSFVFSFSIGF